MSNRKLQIIITLTYKQNVNRINNLKVCYNKLLRGRNFTTENGTPQGMGVREYEQLVLPKNYHSRVLRLAHAIPMSGNLRHCSEFQKNFFGQQYLRMSKSATKDVAR